MNKLQKITVRLFKKYNVLNELPLSFLSLINQPTTIYQNPFYHINKVNLLPFNKKISYKLYKDFKAIVAILYINYLKNNNIYIDFINELKNTTFSHNCNKIEDYIEKFTEDYTLRDFISSAFLFESTSLGWHGWYRHSEDANAYVNSFLYSA